MRINIIPMTFFVFTCGLNAITPENRQKAQEIVRIYKQNGIEEIDPDEVMQLLAEFAQDSDEQETSTVDSEEQANEQPSESIDGFRYTLAKPLEKNFDNSSQARMSDSSKDLPAAYECVTKRHVLSKFSGKKQTRLDSKYYLALLFFNLHHQEEEFMYAYLAMCVQMFIEYYNEAAGSSANNMKIAKGMIRAIYAANRIGEKSFARMLLNLYREKYKSYNASQFEKNLLKNV